MSLEYNSDTRGVTANYGTRPVEGKYGSSVPGEGFVKTATWIFDYDDLPTGGTGNQNVSLPAYAKIISAKLEIITAFTSTSTTSDLLIGLEQNDNTAIDVDGLIAAAQATQTAIGTDHNLVEGAGALIGEDIGAAAGELVVAPSVDDLLTGKGRVIVEYFETGT